MLIRFKVENFRSIRDEQTLSLVASADDSLAENLIATDAISPLRLLRFAAVYGGNASGKSNVLRALDFMRWMVLFSQTRLESKESEIGVTPFLLDNIYSKQPTKFEVEFINNGVRTAYGFSTKNKYVVSEWLATYPKMKRRILFERVAKDENKFSIRFGPSLKNAKEHHASVRKVTRRNSLVLSAAAQTNFEELSHIYSWFSDRLMTVFPENREWAIHSLMERLKDDEPVKDRVLSLLAYADLGIIDLNTNVRKVPDELFEAVKKTLKAKAFEEFKKTFGEQTGLALIHQDSSDDGATLSLDQESRGTRNLLALINPVLSSLDAGATLIIDEFTASLHPHVALQLLEFLRKHWKDNDKGQLIFASHDTNLLNRQIMRRDQIWFVEKDRHGASHLYPLTDFRPRKGENIARGYMQGRYGAIPMIGSSDLAEYGVNRKENMDRTG